MKIQSFCNTQLFSLAILLCVAFGWKLCIVFGLLLLGRFLTKLVEVWFQMDFYQCFYGFNNCDRSFKYSFKIPWSNHWKISTWSSLLDCLIINCKYIFLNNPLISVLWRINTIVFFELSTCVCVISNRMGVQVGWRKINIILKIFDG